MVKKPTRPQLKALRMYADGRARNEKALGIRSNVYDALASNGWVRRVYFLQSTITDKGRAILQNMEEAA